MSRKPDIMTPNFGVWFSRQSWRLDQAGVLGRASRAGRWTLTVPHLEQCRATTNLRRQVHASA